MVSQTRRRPHVKSANSRALLNQKPLCAQMHGAIYLTSPLFLSMTKSLGPQVRDRIREALVMADGQYVQVKFCALSTVDFKRDAHASLLQFAVMLFILGIVRGRGHDCVLGYHNCDTVSSGSTCARSIWHFFIFRVCRWFVIVFSLHFAHGVMAGPICKRALRKNYKLWRHRNTHTDFNFCHGDHRYSLRASDEIITAACHKYVLCLPLQSKRFVGDGEETILSPWFVQLAGQGRWATSGIYWAVRKPHEITHQLECNTIAGVDL
eukprot:SAG31_NODE_984_length_10552_cov_4.679231_8_plen_265_part_00